MEAAAASPSAGLTSAGRWTAASTWLEKLVLLLTNLLAVALAGQCFLYPLLLARLQVERVTLYFFDNVFGLHFALEPAKGVLKRLTFLNTNLCQGKYTSKPSLIGLYL